MKYLIAIVSLFVLVACKQTEIIQYQYKSTTMLGARVITITKDSVSIDYAGRVKTNRTARATTEQEWEELKISTKNVKLDEMANLEAPTNLRQTDAAPFGVIKFTTKDSTYVSKSFDGFNSHVTLLPVMAVIKKISSQNE